MVLTIRGEDTIKGGIIGRVRTIDRGYTLLEGIKGTHYKGRVYTIIGRVRTIDGGYTLLEGIKGTHYKGRVHTGEYALLIEGTHY